MLETRFTGLTRFAIIHRRAVFMLGVVVAMVGGLLTARLSVESDFAHLLPPSASSVQQLHAIERRAQISASVMVGIEAPTPELRRQAAEMVVEKLRRVDSSLVAEVGVDDGIARQFMWQHRFLYASLADLEMARTELRKRIATANPIYVSLDEPEEADPQGQSPLDRLADNLKKANREGHTPEARISKDGRLQLIVVRTTFGSGDVARGEQLLAAIEKANAETAAVVGKGVVFGVAGDVVSTLAEQHGLVYGMVIATAITMILVFLALLWFYRSLLAVLALLFALATGALATFGFAQLTIGHLNLASAFLSSIVIGNGINCGIILLARYFEERRAGHADVEGLVCAVRATVPGTLAATAAASVAYGSLAITQFRGFRDFGIIGGMGMAFCWVATYTLLPAMLFALDRRGWLRPGPEPPISRWITRVLPHRPKWVVMGATSLLVLLSLVVVRFLLHDPLESNMRNLRSYSPALAQESAWMDKFDKAFGHGISGGFAIAVPRRQDAPAMAERLRQADVGKDERMRLFSNIVTIDDVLPKDQEAKLLVLADIRRIMDGKAVGALPDEDRRRVLELRPPDDMRVLTDADVPEVLAWPFTERDGTRGRLVLANNGLGIDSWNLHHLRRFADSVRALNLDPGTLVGGPAFIFSDMLEDMTRDGPRASLASAVGSILIVLLTVGFSRFAFAPLFCGALGTIAMVAISTTAGVKINFLDFVALPITIGIGIDYSVNIATRARHDGDGRAALAATAGAVILCSFTTVVGYGSLLISQNRGIRTFGLSAMVGEITCLISAIVVTPALLVLWRRNCTKDLPNQRESSS
jgi:predicted RND superfamily exporter protein